MILHSFSASLKHKDYSFLDKEMERKILSYFGKRPNSGTSPETDLNISLIYETSESDKKQYGV